MGKKKVQNLKWATAHLSRRLGAGLARHAGGERRRGVRGTGGSAGTGRHRRWAHGLGVLLGCGLCTWCTQSVLTRFDSILFLSQILDIVREPGS